MALVIHNSEAAKVDEIPRLPIEKFRDEVISGVDSGLRIAALFCVPESRGRGALCAVLANDRAGNISLLSSEPVNSYPSITVDCPEAHLFEREIAEQSGIGPLGHPWLKPVRLTDGDRPVLADFFRVGGEEVHEVAVGPVHAGVIEPGHFRFQCHGEEVMHLEIALGYQHRGAWRALAGGPDKRTIHFMETIAGDTTAGHALAYSQVVEALGSMRTPVRAHGLRGIALELERIANHAGDLGALAGDVGFLPTASHCGRIRGDVLNLTALICGSRFGRGMILPGGVGYDLDDERAAKLSRGLSQAMSDFENAAQLIWDSPSVLSRFDDTGAVSIETCESLGLVGPPARACGVARDVRQDHPTGIFRFFHLPASTWHRGDVFARAFVRWMEAKKSAEFIQEQIKVLAGGPVHAPISALEGNCVVVSLVEGWRGEICHVAVTDGAGHFSIYKIYDPSFHNWMGLAMAMRGGEISDFPLCNKSFNLSYCGHDL